MLVIHGVIRQEIRLGMNSMRNWYMPVQDLAIIVAHIGWFTSQCTSIVAKTNVQNLWGTVFGQVCHIRGTMIRIPSSTKLKVIHDINIVEILQLYTPTVWRTYHLRFPKAGCSIALLRTHTQTHTHTMNLEESIHFSSNCCWHEACKNKTCINQSCG